MRKIWFLRSFKNKEQIEKLLLALNDRPCDEKLKRELSKLIPNEFHLSFQLHSKTWCVVDRYGMGYIGEYKKNIEGSEYNETNQNDTE